MKIYVGIGCMAMVLASLAQAGQPAAGQIIPLSQAATTVQATEADQNVLAFVGLAEQPCKHYVLQTAGLLRIATSLKGHTLTAPQKASLFSAFGSLLLGLNCPATVTCCTHDPYSPSKMLAAHGPSMVKRSNKHDPQLAAALKSLGINVEQGFYNKKLVEHIIEHLNAANQSDPSYYAFLKHGRATALALGATKKQLEKKNKRA
jgi:hypothetical protein